MGRFDIEANNYIVSRSEKPIDWELYYENVLRDYREMKEQYPFAYLTIPPTVKPKPAIIRVIAANKGLIDAVGGVEDDFLGEYSRELHLIISPDYLKSGCDVYGAKWVDVTRFANHDIHFFHEMGELIRHNYGLKMCVGTPESFSLMKNVILENVRTAENMLIAYERVMSGASDKLELIAYSHGDKGRNEFQNSRNKYIP